MKYCMKDYSIGKLWSDSYTAVLMIFPFMDNLPVLHNLSITLRQFEKKHRQAALDAYSVIMFSLTPSSYYMPMMESRFIISYIMYLWRYRNSSVKNIEIRTNHWRGHKRDRWSRWRKEINDVVENVMENTCQPIYIQSSPKVSWRLWKCEYLNFYRCNQNLFLTSVFLSEFMIFSAGDRFLGQVTDF